MCACKDPDFCPDVPDEPMATAPEPVAEAEPKTRLRRRTFLKTAALGTAAVGGLKLGSLAGLAHTDSKSPCTAGDIELTGGQIINLPCDCSSTSEFQAVARFEVTNNNNANRLNITLHLGPGGLLGERDFVLRTGEDGLSGSCSIGGLGTTQTMYANLGVLPCNVSTQCYPGSVIAFQTANNQGDSENCDVPLTKYPGGQCRRQEVCIIGFDADLACGGSCDGATSDDCTVPCGGTLVLRASASGGTFGSNGTYTFVVTDPDGLEAGNSGAGASSPHCFTIDNPKTGTYTLQAFDSNGCVRSDTTNVTVVEIPAPDLAAGDPDCSGSATFTVTNCDPTLTYTYESATGSPSPQSGVGLCSVSFAFPQDGANHTVTVTASNDDPACDKSDSAEVHINEPVTVELGPFVQDDCSGSGTFTAVASGGSGEYTFQWTVNGVPQPAVTGDTLWLPGQPDGECRTVEVTATDSEGCVSEADTDSISQCVVTTTPCA